MRQNTSIPEKFKPGEANLPEAVEFIFSLPTAMMHLTAIDPLGKRRPVGKSFAKTDSGKAAALKWITQADEKGYGTYFNCNEVSPPLGPAHVKASEADISTVHFLHVDVDPPEGTPADRLETVRTEMLAKIKQSNPSLVINSGNGYGVFFAIDPVTVTDENRDDIKARNIALADQLGGDDCENLDRVMRLPFTVNRPSAKKIKAGRVPVLADIITDDRNFIAYTLDQFKAADVSIDDPSRAQKPATKSSGPAGTAYAAIGSPEIPETVDLSALDDALRALVVDGAAAGADRSAAVYGVACDLRRDGWSDGAILAVLTNATNGIADHIFDQKQREPLEQASRVIMDMNRKGVTQVFSEKGSEDFADDPPEDITPTVSAERLAEQRAERAAAKANAPKTEKPDAGKKKPWDNQCALIVSPPAFVDIRRRKLLNNKSFDHRFGYIGGDDAHRKAIKSKLIKRYHGIGFRPIDVRSFKVDGQSVFNLFKPHTIEEMEGLPLILIEHLRYLIPDVASRQHFVNWLAWLVQYPDKKLMHAALLLGKKGTGKSVIGELMKVILGKHNCSEPSRKRVASEFNGWLANKLLVIIHELREKGARGLYDELKEYITQGTTSINLKGIEAHEVDNFSAFLTITNHDDAIPIDDNERRYLVIRCADDPRFGKGTDQSREYYDRLFACIGTSDAPGDEARKFLRFLRARDLSKYNGQGPAPETEAKADMVEASLNSVERFVREKLEVREWPLCGPIISPVDVLNELPFDLDKANRTIGNVEAALREIGARPLKEYKQLRTKTGRKRLWALEGSTVRDIVKTKSHKDVTAIYDAMTAARQATEGQADAEEARAELAGIM